MIKKSLYPKTKRVSSGKSVIITEKLDGSNIGFFKVNGDLLIATRNNVFYLSEAKEVAKLLYKGMAGWLEEHGEHLKNSLCDNSGFFGEWMGMGKLKYENLDKRVYIFAKTNIDEEFEVRNIIYFPELFIYPFVNQEIPEYLGVVPVVNEAENIPTIEGLDVLYNEYTEKVSRDVEGFIVNYNNNIKKYVRMKNGKLTDHQE